MANWVDAVNRVVIRKVVLIISFGALTITSGKEGVFRVLRVVYSVHARFDELLVRLLRVSHLSIPSDHRAQQLRLKLTFKS